VIDDGLCHNLKAMVGFRNIAIHDYQTLQLEIVQAIIDKHFGISERSPIKAKEYLSTEGNGA